MRRRFHAGPYLLALALGLLFAACSEQPNSVPDDATASPDISHYSTPCSTADINALIDQIFQRPALAALFKVKVNLYIKLSQNGPKPAQRAKLHELISELLKLSDSVSDPVKLRKIEALIRLLYCILGEQAPALDLVNGDAAVVTPTTGATVAARCQVNCETGANDAATKIEPGDLPANVPSAVVSILPISRANPLNTSLDQRGPFFEITVTPNVTFASPVLVGMCLNKANNASDDRLRLAHDLSPSLPVTEGNIRFGNIEIISPDVTLEDLDLACADQVIVEGLLKRAFDWLLPEKLYAGGQGTGGRGGLVSNYSPFGGVDPQVTVSANSAQAQTGTAAHVVSDPPSVVLQTASGTRVSGVSVSFTPAAGSGSVTGSPKVTDASGIATVGSWTLSGTPGTNTLTASPTTLGVTYVPASVTFTAMGEVRTVFISFEGGTAPDYSCEAESDLRSLTSDTATQIRFENRTGEPVRVQWLDYEGLRVMYYDGLPDGTGYTQQTYLTHPWIITTASGICMGIWMP